MCQGLRCTPAVPANLDMKRPCQTSAQSPVPRTERPEVPTQSALPQPYSSATLWSRLPCFCTSQFHQDLPLHRTSRGAGYRTEHSSCLFSRLPRASVRPLLRARPLGSKGRGQGSPPGAERRPLRGLLPLPLRVRQATAPSHSTFQMSLHPKTSGSLLHLRAAGPDSGQWERAA